YKVYSCNRICRDSGRFFTLETARVRYLHLSPGIQAVIDSPERLLELEKMALSLMKSKVRNRQHSNFMSCFNALVESISGTRCQNS
ncbi:MAG: hypothetical protein NT118_07925, partial [Lentisphaerae bacterium]|nr:hypothetical protein [Lentisphaerota bacterium]